MGDSTYSVHTYSSGRYSKIDKILSMFPEINVHVRSDEYLSYAAVVPGSQLFNYDIKPDETLPSILNSIFQTVDDDYTCFVSDKVIGFRSKVWPRPKNRVDPDFIDSVFQNAVDILDDLQLPLYGWSSGGSVNLTDCFSMTKPVKGAFVMKTGAYKFDEQFELEHEFDLSLQVLLEDRVVLTDQRFEFDIEELDQYDIRTVKQQDKQNLKAKWLGNVRSDASKGVGRRGKKKTTKVNVTRRQKLV